MTNLSLFSIEMNHPNKLKYARTLFINNIIFISFRLHACILWRKNKYNVWKNKKIQNSSKLKEYESKIFHSQTCSKSIFHCALINVILSEIANIELNFVSLIIIICLMRTFSSCKQYHHAKMSVFTVLWNIFWPVLLTSLNYVIIHII